MIFEFIFEFICKIIAYVYVVIFFTLCFIGLIITIWEIIEEAIWGKSNDSR